VKKAHPSQGDNQVQAGVRSVRLELPTTCLTVSVEDAARILGISRGAAYAHVRDGSIPSIRLGKRLLVPRAALDKMLMVA